VTASAEALGFVVKKVVGHPLDPDPLDCWWCLDLMKRTFWRGRTREDALTYLWHYLEREKRLYD
jgi:hypothetical protein